MHKPLSAVLLFAGCASAPHPAPPDRTRTDALHRRAIVVDAHADTTQAIVYRGYDFAQRHEFPESMEDLPRLQQGGLDAQIFSIWLDPATTPRERWFAETERQFVALRDKLSRVSGLRLATTAREVRENAAQGITSALFGVEGGYLLQPGSPDEELAHLRRFAQLGARYLTLTHVQASSLGGSSGDASEGQGLTDFGRRALDELQRLGVVIDLSHVSDPLFWDAIRYARKPVLASHSSSRQLANVPRNLSDAMLRAIAKNGGAACVNFFDGFLDQETFARARRVGQELEARGLHPDQMPFRQQWALYTAQLPVETLPDLSRVADHLEHMVKVAGIDHVCLGSDFDGIPLPPRSLEDASKLPDLTAELVRRGFSDVDVEKVLGGNLLRVLEASEPGLH